MPSRKHFNPGEPVSSFTADDYRDIMDRIAARRKLSVTPPLRIVNDSPTTIDLALPEGFYGSLTGSASPYSFTEKYGTAAGTWATRVRTGTSNAYEVNGVAGLGGKTVWLEPGAPGDYRFQYVAGGVATGRTCGSCSGIADNLTVTFRFTPKVVDGDGSVTGTPGACYAGPATSMTFPITWNSGSVTIYQTGVPSTVTGYWESGCIDFSAYISCTQVPGCVYSPPPAASGSQCSFKVYFYCGGAADKFRLAEDVWRGAGCTGTRTGSSVGPNVQYEFSPTTCDPFYWKTSGINPLYQISE